MGIGIYSYEVTLVEQSLDNDSNTNAYYDIKKQKSTLPVL